MQVTPPTVGRLLMRNRVWAWRHAKTGRFGPVTVRSKPITGQINELSVSLAGVEAFAGQTFTPVQLAAAGIKQPQEAA